MRASNSRISTKPPRKRRGARLCVVATTDGTTVYSNAAAMESIAEWLLWIAKSDPTEHFELHVLWHLANHADPELNVWTLFDDKMRRVFVRPATSPDSGGPFELTFMHATKEDLARLHRQVASKAIPREWRQVEAQNKKPRSPRRWAGKS